MLSPEAQRLLDALRTARDRHGPGQPLTDARLAQAVGVPVRRVIDLAYELIAAGHLVVASCDRIAPGRFLLLPGDDLRPAWQYLRVLESRGRKVFTRLQHFRTALEAAERTTAVDTRGQLSLGLGLQDTMGRRAGRDRSTRIAGDAGTVTGLCTPASPDRLC